jgi:exosortase A-associated hydrolase 1
MAPDEAVIRMSCGGECLLGIVHSAQSSDTPAFVFVVGGPQYRVGSHRMFVDMARELAANGYPVLRFDCRGMGDSDGVFDSFESLDEDIRCAIDAALEETERDRVVLLGLCDGASACAMYASQDPRVCALVLINPWVRTEQVQSRALIKHYYSLRLLQPAFWRDLLGGRLDIRASVKSLAGHLARTVGTQEVAIDYIERMRQQLAAFSGSVLVVLSGQDLTAREFSDLSQATPSWRKVLSRPNVRELPIPSADHTFSGAGQLPILIEEIAKNLAITS